MPAFERNFMGPSADQVAEALNEAVTTANYRCRINKLEPDPEAYRRAAGEVTTRGEGVRRWIEGVANPDECPPNHRATLLGVAWWTDPLGRRHVRVVGKRLEQFNEMEANRFGPLGPARPPLALLDPDHMVLRTPPGGKPELVAVCGCGAIGEPASLGWMGDCCGPCHDHREEKDRPLGTRRLTLRQHTLPVIGVGFSASGKRGVSADDGGRIYLWEPRTLRVRAVLDMNEDGAPYHDPGFACNGHRVAMASYFHGLRCWNADTGAEEGHWDAHAHRSYTCLALSPDGRYLAAGDWSDVTVWQVTANGRRKGLAEIRGGADCLSFNPDGSTVAVGRTAEGAVSLHALGRGSPREYRCPGGWVPRGLAFAPDGSGLAAALGENVSFEEFGRPADPAVVPAGGVVWFREGTAHVLHQGQECLTVAFAPDGRTLAAAGSDRVLRFWAMPEGRFLGGLEWHVGAVRSVAFSPDGELLASGGHDGLVRLWPWRQLLGVPAPEPPRATRKGRASGAK